MGKQSSNTSKSVSEREIRHSNIARMAATEGIVLIKNNGILPLDKNTKIALYGAGAKYTVKGGTGSGDVNNRNNISVYKGLENAGFYIENEEWLREYDKIYEDTKRAWINKIYEIAGKEDFRKLSKAYSENPMPLPKTPKISGKATAEVAIYVISRISGEGADRHREKGDYYLSDEEMQNIRDISNSYKHLIIVLNVGGIMDLSFMEEVSIDALILLSQAGMEGGNAFADVITGAVNPSGCLTDTWSYRYEDYPSSENFSHNNGNLIEELYSEGIYVGYRYFDSFKIKPRYAFGYGLSYTTFDIKVKKVYKKNGNIYTDVIVENTGNIPGKKVIFIYVSCPDGKLIKEDKRLVAFAKTGLINAGEKEKLSISFSLNQLESYHSGKQCYILEQGEYGVLIGGSTEETSEIAVLKLDKDIVTTETDNICPLMDALKEITPEKTKRTFEVKTVINLKENDIARRKIKYASDKIATTKYMKQAKKLSVQEAATLCCGRPKECIGDIIGSASIKVQGAAGETTPLLKDKYGLESIVFADGPAGIRLFSRYEENPEDGSIYQMNRYERLENRYFNKEFYHDGAIQHYQFCTAIPIGTMLAQTFNEELLQAVGRMISAEMVEFGVTLWLAPGMNIHRNPLCGRNFEYYSEDPFVSGKMAAAITRGVQENVKTGTCIKHFACNNQEDNRRGVSSIVSERALREIYLKGFEIAVKESQPYSIMTSYNKINGVHTANSYDLCTKAARTEWEFDGIIMTDWTTTNSGGGSSAAKCISAGNDLIMPGLMSDIKEIIDAVNKEGNLNLKEECLRKCAARIIKLIDYTKQMH